MRRSILPLILRYCCVLFVAGLVFAGAQPGSATLLFTNEDTTLNTPFTDSTGTSRLFANAQFISVVPESSTALLMGLGLGALAVRRRA